MPLLIIVAEPAEKVTSMALTTLAGEKGKTRRSIEHRAWSRRAQLSRASRHMPPASLGQDAALSFVVRGKGSKKPTRRSGEAAPKKWSRVVISFTHIQFS